MFSSVQAETPVSFISNRDGKSAGKPPNVRTLLEIPATMPCFYQQGV
jgi:hypothetical protein